jgi:hypothetical protein
VDGFVEDTPAAKCKKIEFGDILTHVEGKDTTELSPEEVLGLLTCDVCECTRAAHLTVAKPCGMLYSRRLSHARRIRRGWFSCSWASSPTMKLLFHLVTAPNTRPTLRFLRRPGFVHEVKIKEQQLAARGRAQSVFDTRHLDHDAGERAVDCCTHCRAQPRSMLSWGGRCWLCTGAALA